MKRLMKKAAILLLPFVGISLTSCVNEWPDIEGRLWDVSLRISCVTDWIPDYEMTYTRTDNPEIEYLIRVYPKGTTEIAVSEFTYHSNDFRRSPFSVDFKLPEGEYDIYIWSDIADRTNGESLFYDSENFGAITFRTPYQGDSNLKDAFRGMTSIVIEKSSELLPAVEQEIILRRPLGRFYFVATDVEDYISQETIRNKMRNIETAKGFSASPPTRDEVLQELFSAYSVKVTYPLYLAAVFDNFTNNPIDSWTNVSFTGGITMMGTDKAEVGLDYAMVVGDESALQAQLEIMDDTGNVISRTSIIKIPLERDRTTIVYGRFLTTLESGGVGINPDFQGEYNIEIK